MNVKTVILKWNDKCCGCNTNIPKNARVFIVNNITGIDCSIHLCANCVNKISESLEEVPEVDDGT